MRFAGLLCSTLALLSPLGVFGALDDNAKIANRTIERVSVVDNADVCGSVSCGEWVRVGVNG